MQTSRASSSVSVSVRQRLILPDNFRDRHVIASHLSSCDAHRLQGCTTLHPTLHLIDIAAPHCIRGRPPSLLSSARSAALPLSHLLHPPADVGRASASRAPAHQNATAFRHNPRSRLTAAIARIPTPGSAGAATTSSNGASAIGSTNHSLPLASARRAAHGTSASPTTSSARRAAARVAPARSACTAAKNSSPSPQQQRCSHSTRSPPLYAFLAPLPSPALPSPLTVPSSPLRCDPLCRAAPSLSTEAVSALLSDSGLRERRRRLIAREWEAGTLTDEALHTLIARYAHERDERDGRGSDEVSDSAEEDDDDGGGEDEVEQKD